MAQIVLLHSGDEAIIPIDWLAPGEPALPDGVTLTGTVEHIVPAPLTRISQATDTANSMTQVKVSGMVHGGLYLITGRATLSNGEIINRPFPVRCFNG